MSFLCKQGLRSCDWVLPLEPPDQLSPSRQQGAWLCRPRQLEATALLPLPGDQGGAAPPAAAPAAAAAGLPAALLRRGLQLHSGQQLRKVLLPHAEVHQWATPHLEGSARLAAPLTSLFTGACLMAPERPVTASTGTVQGPARTPPSELGQRALSGPRAAFIRCSPRAGNLGSHCPGQFGRASWLVLGSLETTVSWRAKHFVNSDLFVEQHY